MCTYPLRQFLALLNQILDELGLERLVALGAQLGAVHVEPVARLLHSALVAGWAAELLLPLVVPLALAAGARTGALAHRLDTGVAGTLLVAARVGRGEKRRKLAGNDDRREELVGTPRPWAAAYQAQLDTLLGFALVVFLGFLLRTLHLNIRVLLGLTLHT
jgi:hypothetical protein